MDSMLVSTGWLTARLRSADLVVVDLRWRENGSGRAKYEAGHIPGAVFVDWTTDLVDPFAPVAFTLATPERIGALMERCGIGDTTPVVAYADGFGSGPYRLWLACRTYGHDQVRVLDGGLEKWLVEGRPVSREPVRPRPPATGWHPWRGERLVCGMDEVVEAGARETAIVLDSRPPEQFRGEAVWFETGAVRAGPDGIARTPRGELRAGRVPWARNVPASTLYRPDHTLKSPEELGTLFAEAGVDVASSPRVITYCGVGISASALLFALRVAGLDDVALYDGSWEEWGRDPALPVARGD